MTNSDIAKENIRQVAKKLGHLRDRVVFLGGSVTALLIVDTAAPDVRETKDIDVAYHSRSYPQTCAMDDELRALGFKNSLEPDAPKCRWTIDGLIVDVIPVGPVADAYHDRWSSRAIDNAEQLEVAEGILIRHVTAPYLVAIKLETFFDRGEGDFQYSQDIEDIILLLDGRPELIDEIKASESDACTYIVQEFRKLLENQRFIEAVPAHLLPDAASQSREVIIRKRMSVIAGFCPASEA